MAKSQSLQFCDGNKLTQTRMPYLKVLLPQHTITTLHTIQTTTLVLKHQTKQFYNYFFVYVLTTNPFVYILTINYKIYICTICIK